VESDILYGMLILFTKNRMLRLGVVDSGMAQTVVTWVTLLCVAPQSQKTPVSGGVEVLAGSTLSPSRSVDSQLNNLSVSISTPVSQQHRYVVHLAVIAPVWYI